MELQPADWELETISPEEQAAIDKLHRALNEPNLRDSLKVRLANQQAAVAETQARLEELGDEDVVYPDEQPWIPSSDDLGLVSEALDTPGTSTDHSAHDAVDLVTQLEKPEEVKAWVDGDDRKTVKDAAAKHIDSLT